NIIQHIKENNQLQLNSQAMLIIKQCWVKFAICSKAVFAESIFDNNYVRLDVMLQNLSIDLLKVFLEEFSNLPNLHVLCHLSEHA
ncbi:17898_t:CDS:2, partial [Rhizophagus irregularis]